MIGAKRPSKYRKKIGALFVGYLELGIDLWLGIDEQKVVQEVRAPRGEAGGM
jgi:hypothetical protein